MTSGKMLKVDFGDIRLYRNKSWFRQFSGKQIHAITVREMKLLNKFERISISK